MPVDNSEDQKLNARNTNLSISLEEMSTSN